jgi:hypothetical protein
MTLTASGAVRAVALTLAVCSLGACATVTRGVHQDWSVDTDPSGAQVKTSNGFACDKTPCTLRVERKREFDVAITKDGYKPYHGHVFTEISKGGVAGMAGNVVAGGIIGVGVDAMTGSMNSLRPNPLKVKMETVDSSADSEAVTISAPSKPNGGH